MTNIARLRADPSLAALHRSLDVYYGDPARDAAMDRLYARFLDPGDLAFDIGSHVGDRIGSFRRCGARVVALEPQPDCARVIGTLYGGDRDVHLIAAACGAAAGRVTLHINSANPTVTTASPEFVRAAEGQAGWEGQVWDRTIEVPVTTLDALVAQFGTPAFVKIDVEGFEDQVLAGLSRVLPVLSFEFTTIQRDVAYRCLQRLAEISPPCRGAVPGARGAAEVEDSSGLATLPHPLKRAARAKGEGLAPRSRGEGYLFNLALGESQRLAFDAWITADEMASHILALPHEANSGDVYAIATVPG